MKKTYKNQGLDRILAILRAVAIQGREGVRLTAIATATGFSRSTTHRLVGALNEAGLLEYDDNTSTYHLGFVIFELGQAAVLRFDLQQAAEASLIRLAERSQDTVYLQVRSGDDALCIARQEGRYPIKTVTLNVGDRRPLGVGAGSLALLSGLLDDEAERIIEANKDRLAQFPGFTPQLLRDLLATTHREGFAFNRGIMHPGMRAIGLPLMHPNGTVAGALSIGAISSRIDGPLLIERLAWLREEVSAIEEKLRERGALVASLVRPPGKLEH